MKQSKKQKKQHRLFLNQKHNLSVIELYSRFRFEEVEEKSYLISDNDTHEVLAKLNSWRNAQDYMASVACFGVRPRCTIVITKTLNPVELPNVNNLKIL